MRFALTKSFLLFASLLHTCLLFAMYKYSNTFVFNFQLKKMETNEEFEKYEIKEDLVDTKTGTTPKMLRSWPEEEPDSDRIVDQLLLAEKIAEENKNNKLRSKKIYLNEQWNYISHQFSSFFNGCPVSACEVTQYRTSDLDAYLFRETIPFPRTDTKRQNEIWIYYSLESPYSYEVMGGIDFINWTATYRLDSDIATPYGKFVQKSFNNSKGETATEKHRNYAKGKTKKVAWFVSNCGANNDRLEFARELSRYIKVDIYGSCGRKQCARYESSQCFDLLKNYYKFYLSFENSNCRDYITEKFFINALQNDVVPIVMGARKEDYDKIAPQNSFIHVDQFESPKSLAAYLHRLDHNDALYNNYFKWKETGEFIDTGFWCRLCALLHSKYEPKHYPDLRDWWQSKDVCFHNKRRL